jgi:hypothetical protein
MDDWKVEKPGIWLNIYVLCALAWGSHLYHYGPGTFMFWFLLAATLIASVAAAIQFVAVLRQVNGRDRD